jgi:hypothetical protein
VDEVGADRRDVPTNGAAITCAEEALHRDVSGFDPLPAQPRRRRPIAVQEADRQLDSGSAGADREVGEQCLGPSDGK